MSLDTLRADRFLALTRFDELARVHAGIAAAHRAFGTLKIDSVIIKGVNDDELVELLEYGKRLSAEIRFIEYMDVGGATHWSPAAVFSRANMLQTLGRYYGAVTPIVEATSAPADRFRLPDGTVFGIISSTTDPFCRACDRSRLTADGMWYLCLYATHGLDLRAAVRQGAGPEALQEMIAARWGRRRFAAQRPDSPWATAALLCRSRT